MSRESRLVGINGRTTTRDGAVTSFGERGEKAKKSSFGAEKDKFTSSA